MADEEEKLKKAYKPSFEWWQYWIQKNAQTKEKPEEPSPDDALRHAPEPPLTSPSSSSGPDELKQTATNRPLAPVEMGFIEVCPYCDEVLEIYHTHNVLTGDREWRCKKCFGELKRSPRGWVKKDEEEKPDERRSTFGF
jgi:predicted RNA-binding Zn-ribbon protein involved in translation (DUF1610 family)